MSVFDLSQSLADTLFGWSNAALTVGAFLVLVGTIGVFWTGGIRERYADERISKNEAETAAAKATAAVANEHAASANERTEVLRQSNLEVQRQLEKERIDRLRLEASIAPRRLSDNQRSSLLSALLAAPQPLTVEFTLIGDQEATLYGNAIGAALEAARVRGNMVQIGMVTPPPYGVMLTLRNGSQKSLAIKAAFEKAQIPVTISFGDIGTFDAKILVGLRPLGPHQ
ncbi:MAG: hypothetical protein ABIJ01_03385 [Pseudomonadota bacterium]